MISEELKQAIKDDKLVIFVGAGCSIPLGFPTWKELVKNVLDNLNEQYSASSNLNFLNLKAKLERDEVSPLSILNVIENDPDAGSQYVVKSKEYIYKLFSEKSKESQNSEIHKSLWSLSSKMITTNYDHVLKNNSSSSTVTFTNNNDFQALQSQRTTSDYLFQIHGDYQNPETIIVFESDYNRIYSSGTAVNDTMASIFKNNMILFIGFSLSDPFINNLFTSIKEIYKKFTVGNHYILSTRASDDFSELDVKQINIDNYDEALNSFISELIKLKRNPINDNLPSVSPQIIQPLLLEEDAEGLLLLIKSKTEDLIKDPSNKVLSAEIHDIRGKMNILLYGDLDYLKSFNNEHRNTHLEMLFETIYSGGHLSTETIDEINRIRTDFQNHRWYERAQLVSAIACSLSITNKADLNRISILIDFINDNEDYVWDRALTYLVIVLNQLGNKWLRFDPIKRKVQSLTLNYKVQNACQKIIEYILVFGIENFNLSSKVFTNPFFKDSPYNYFLPFFKEENPLFENVYDNYQGDDIEDYIRFLEECPVPDALKYIWCNSEIKEREVPDVEVETKWRNYVMQHLSINKKYTPFAGYIQQFISFLDGFPPLNHKKIKDAQLKITTTPLKDYLLNEQEKTRALGIHFIKEKQWGQAIVNFEKYLKVAPDDMMVIDNLANCYVNNKEKDKAKDILKKVLQKKPGYEPSIIKLTDILLSQEKFEEAYSVLESAMSDQNADIYYKKAIVLQELNRFDEALEAINICDALNFDDKGKVYNLFGLIYKKLHRFDDALKSFNSAICFEENSIYYANRADLWGDKENHELALKDFLAAINLNSGDEDLLIRRIYVLLNLNRFEEAKIELSKIKRKNYEYDNALANYFRMTGDYEKAFLIIEKLISTREDKRFLGTKAAIYASMGDDENFYELLKAVLEAGVKAKNFLIDIKNKYRYDHKFTAILKSYNQTI